MAAITILGTQSLATPTAILNGVSARELVDYGAVKFFTVTANTSAWVTAVNFANPIDLSPTSIPLFILSGAPTLPALISTITSGQTLTYNISAYGLEGLFDGQSLTVTFTLCAQCLTGASANTVNDNLTTNASLSTLSVTATPLAFGTKLCFDQFRRQRALGII